MLARGVDIYAYMVYYALYCLLQALSEARLIYIVLILPYTN